MPGFSTNSVYAATFEQFFREGGAPLAFIWHHGESKIHRLVLKSDGTFKGTGLKEPMFNFTPKVLALGAARDATGKIIHKNGCYYNEFPFPLSFGAKTPSCVGLGAYGSKQYITRYISADPTMEARIVELNEHVTAHYASALASNGEGHDDEDRWFMAQRYISNSSTTVFAPKYSSVGVVSAEASEAEVQAGRKNKGTLKKVPDGVEVKHEVRISGEPHTWLGVVENGRIMCEEDPVLRIFTSPSGFAKAHIIATRCGYSRDINGWNVCKGLLKQEGRAEQWVKLDEFRM